MKLKAVLLDLDGTLVNTNELIIETFVHTLTLKLGTCPPVEEIVKTFGKPLREVLEDFAPGRMQELFDEYQSYQQSLDPQKYITLCPNVRPALDAFKAKGLKLAVVTSKRKVGAEQNLSQFQLFGYFDAVVTCEDTQEHKPTAEPARHALDLLGVTAAEAIMIGDSTYDILCGQACGTKTAAVAYSAYERDYLLSFNPDYYLRDLTELLTYLD